LPVTPREAEAALRRCLIDVAMPAPTRLAALSILTTGRRWGLREAATFNGVAERGSNRGLLGKNLVLSPSQAQSYELCPRRYVLERRLRVGSDTSQHAIFGTLIHDVLEKVEKRALPSGRRSTLQEALTEFESQFDSADFDGPPFSDSWETRGRVGLEKLYTNWPASERQAAFLELTLNAEIGGVQWTGRADRIDVSPVGLTVVDYKTSKTPTTGAEAAQSLQLGFYALAAQRTPEVAARGNVIGAEFWYPMAKGKKVSTREFAIENLSDVEDRLTAIGAGIKGENWEPTPGPHCDKCGLRPLCPAWAEGGAGFE